MLGVRRAVIQGTRSLTQKRQMSGGLPSMLQSTVWRKSTGLYITYIVAGCVVIETVYGGLTNAVWNGMNGGVSRHLSLLRPWPPKHPSNHLRFMLLFDCNRNSFTRSTGPFSSPQRTTTTMMTMTSKTTEGSYSFCDCNPKNLLFFF